MKAGPKLPKYRPAGRADDAIFSTAAAKGGLMWFGRVVPLFRFPLLKTGNLHSHTGEERLLPLPDELCVGMNIDEGTALYATYGVNPNLRRKEDQGENSWGDDLAGWIAIAPFPPSLFGSPRIMRLGAHVKNKPGSFREGITKLISADRGVFLGMEILGYGDMGSLVLLPPNANENITNDLRKKLRGKIEASPDVIAIHEKKWKKRRTGSLDLIDQLFAKKPKKFPEVRWAEDRRILIRDHQITVPYGDFWHQLHQDQKDKAEEDGSSLKPEDRITPVDYCLLARDMELPVLLALFPSRPLFRLDVSVVAREESFKDGQTGSGMLDKITNHLSAREINIWHIKNTYRSLVFDQSSKDDPNICILRGVESVASIIAAVPKARRHDGVDAITTYLKDLRERLLHMRRMTNSDNAPGISNEYLADLTSGIAEKIEAWEDTHPDWKNDPLWKVSREDILKECLTELNAIADKRLEAIEKLHGEADFIKEVEIHGPPLFRCFFSHSARPDYDERDYIDKLKLLLESEVFEVIEGEFSLGMSTEKLSRGRISHCDLFVSFLWPRSDFRTDKGAYLPPEWVIHEESFAIGHGLPVYRVREKSVEPPRYEHDRVDFPFMRGDVQDWQNLEQKFRREIRQIALETLLSAKPPRSKKRLDREGDD